MCIRDRVRPLSVVGAGAGTGCARGGFRRTDGSSAVSAFWARGATRGWLVVGARQHRQLGMLSQLGMASQ
eukprot:12283790-Alexandrium_andersonii.AAC.1